MIDDDDPKTAPASPESAAGETVKTPSPPEAEEPEGEQPETDGSSDEEQLDLTLDDDEEGDDDGDEDDGEGEEPKQKSKSRSERYNQRIRDLEVQNEALRSRDSGRLPPPPNEQMLLRELERRVSEDIGDEPRIESFRDAQGNPDFVRFHSEHQAWLGDRRASVRENRKDMLREIEAANARAQDLVDAHKRRIARHKSSVKDWDELMAKATVQVAHHVERLIIQSKRSDKLTEVLARNQSKLAQLNRMDPESAAREIGRIEGRLSHPQSPQQTKARKPIVPLRGGGTSPPNQNAQRDAYLKRLYGKDA